MKIEGTPDIYERSNLTKHQWLVWLGQKLHPEVPLYNMVVTFTLSGKVDRGHFQKAFQTLVNSSDALRTVIEETDGAPQQKVLETFSYEMEFLDFSAGARPEAGFENWLRDRCRAAFDFHERLFDSALAKIADDRYVWYFNQHHIVSDGWSVWLAYRYVAELYGRSLRGGLEAAVALPRFQDHVLRQREEQASPRQREAEAYWERKLAEKLPPLNISSGSKAKWTAEAQRTSCELGVERTRKLKTFAARQDIAGAAEHVSIFNVFAAILFAYLHRISGNSRLSIGVPFHNRSSEASLKDTLGLVMKVLPLRITIDPGDNFLSVIEKVRAELSEIRPFRKVALGNPLHNKLYDVLLNYHTVTYPQFQGIPVHVERVHTPRENDLLAIRVHDFDGAGSFKLDFDFDSGAFDDEQRRRVVGQFLQIFDAFLEDPAASLHSVSLLTAEERRRILIEWNDTKRNYSMDKCLHDLFEEQVERTPDRTAIVFEDRQLTYRELNRRANQLAHYLKRLGVGPEALVGICLDRSLDMIIALLGIGKAGGAYLPLEPRHAKERVAFILEDSRALAVLTRGQLSNAIAEKIKVVDLKSERETIGGQSEENPIGGATPGSLAYVIYTSGSTGIPKGVLIEHRQILNYVQGIRERYQLEPGAGFALVQPLFVDSSQTVIFPSLISGGCLHVISEDQAFDPVALGEYFSRFPIDLLKIAPSHLAALQASPHPEYLLPRRWLVVGGEVSHWDWMDKLRAMASCAIYNHYGPTEATVGMLTYEVRKDETGARSQAVPIGRPLPNTRAFLLDRQLQPVPVGVAGELHIGGGCLARGYLNRPELTAEKFIPDPFSEEPEARLYKTGDLVRYLPDGNIEFIGRIDDQVKIRGFRIEPAEIEATLERHPTVRRAVVLAREDTADDPSTQPGTGKRLVAYLAVDPEQALEPAHLRAYLKEKLPSYMIPESFVLLDSLPLTPHGKVDRRSLPAPRQFESEPIKDFVAPRTVAEKALAKIWAEVLVLKQVGIHDNFFDLGGHSIKAMQIVSRIRQTFLVEIPLRSLFETPTIAEIADLLQRRDAEAGTQKIPLLSRSQRAKSPL
jgi:amino acid adenylation domain-containing protein